MEIIFTPSPDVSVVLNSLLDILERRTQPTTRAIRVTLADLPLLDYFSQANPEPRLIANEQLTHLEKKGLLHLTWIPGERGHLLHSVTLPKTEHIIPQRSGVDETRNPEIFNILARTPIANNRARLERLLLADKFRFQEDWRARAISYILNQLKAEKSPGPFSLTDSNLNLDLLAVLQALPALTAETPYRVFSVRVFNDTKRFEAIKSHIVSLARLGNPEWKRSSTEEVLRELNLVADPNYIHLSGNWQITTGNGKVLDLNGFTPSIGFPAAQISTLQSVRAESVLCIENLTTFHQYTQTENAARTMKQAVLCTYGNPSPAIRRILRLLPQTTHISLWSDMDFGGFHILAQLRKQVSPCIQPYLMDIATFNKHAHLSRPLSQSDIHNLKRLGLNPALADVHLTIHHLLKRGLKLEQEAIQICC